MTSIERLEIGQTIWMRYGNYDRTSKITTTTVKKILPLGDAVRKNSRLKSNAPRMLDSRFAVPVDRE